VNLLGIACTGLAIISCAAGCAEQAPPPVPGSDAVRATTSLTDITDCNLLGKVIVSDASPDPAKAARDQTATLGGNVLLKMNEQVWNGNAYKCPAAAH